MTGLQGKVALISGGARGMGAARARAVIAQGGKVAIAIADVDAGEGRALADELGTDDALFVQLDVTQGPSWVAAIAATVGRFGALNVLVNNAGVLRAGSIETFTHVCDHTRPALGAGRPRHQDWDHAICFRRAGSSDSPAVGWVHAQEPMVADDECGFSTRPVPQPPLAPTWPSWSREGMAREPYGG